MSTTAKLIPEGAFGEPAAASTSTPDSDANEAVTAALAEAGVDRAAVEGSADSFILPAPRSDESADAKPAKSIAAKPTKSEVATPDPSAKPGAGAGVAAPEVDLDLNMTAEELAEIEKNPLMRRLYKVMRRGMNKKFEELAETRKANEADLGIVAAIRKDPMTGLRALAAATGIPITIGGAGGAPAAASAAAPQAPQTPLAIAEAALGKIFPQEGAAALAPALIEIAKAVSAGELQPIRDALAEGQRDRQTYQQAQMSSQLETALGAYGRTVEARGDDWNDEVQVEMSKLVGQVVPGKRADGSTVSLDEYLDVLYHHVTGIRSRESSRTRQLQRLRAAVDAAEPAPVRTSGSPRAMDQRITAEMSDADATTLAVQQAMEDLRGL